MSYLSPLARLESSLGAAERALAVAPGSVSTDPLRALEEVLQDAWDGDYLRKDVFLQTTEHVLHDMHEAIGCMVEISFADLPTMPAIATTDDAVVGLKLIVTAVREFGATHGKWVPHRSMTEGEVAEASLIPLHPHMVRLVALIRAEMMSCECEAFGALNQERVAA